MFAKYLVYKEDAMTSTNVVKNTSNPDWNHKRVVNFKQADSDVCQTSILFIDLEIICMYFDFPHGKDYLRTVGFPEMAAPCILPAHSKQNTVI